MSGNQLPDITLNLTECTLTLTHHDHDRPRQITCNMPQDRRPAWPLFRRLASGRLTRQRIWDAAAPLTRHGRTWQPTMHEVAARIANGFVKSELVPPEPLGHDVETVEDDPADNTSSPYCPVCGQRRALCERDPKCSGAKALARMFPPSLSGQTRKGWLDFITRGCAALRREYALAPLWLIVTRQVPAVVDVLELDDDLVVML